MADQSIQEYFENENLVAISNVDTRAIVKHIRDKGAMNCIISSDILDQKELQKVLNDVPAMEAAEAGLKVIICITEGIPVQDMVKVKAYIEKFDCRLILGLKTDPKSIKI